MAQILMISKLKIEHFLKIQNSKLKFPSFCFIPKLFLPPVHVSDSPRSPQPNNINYNSSPKRVILLPKTRSWNENTLTMSLSRMKKARPREVSHSKDSGVPHGRKKEKVPVHDEADLVNFRADSLARLITNQDFLENVSLKPFHTAHIAPPSLFPTHPKKAYGDAATDAEVEEVAKGLKPGEIYTGDPRLMRAREAILKKELEELNKEVDELRKGSGKLSNEGEKLSNHGEKLSNESATVLNESGATINDIGGLDGKLDEPNKEGSNLDEKLDYASSEESREVIFNEEMIFQGQAVTKLARLRQEYGDLNSLAKMEDSLNEILSEYNTKFNCEYKLQQKKFVQHSIPISELVPNLEVHLAPPLYNPRLITSYLEMKGEEAQKQNINMLDKIGGAGNTSNGFMSETGFEDFGLMLGSDERSDSRQGDPWTGPHMNAQSHTSTYVKTDGIASAQNYSKSIPAGFNHAGPKTAANADNGVDSMVDLNQFLADGMDEGDMDDMEALIDFGQDNNTSNNVPVEESFGVDFLNDIAMDLN